MKTIQKRYMVVLDSPPDHLDMVQHLRDTLYRAGMIANVQEVSGALPLQSIATPRKWGEVVVAGVKKND